MERSHVCECVGGSGVDSGSGLSGERGQHGDPRDSSSSSFASDFSNRKTFSVGSIFVTCLIQGVSQQL